MAFDSENYKRNERHNPLMVRGKITERKLIDFTKKPGPIPFKWIHETRHFGRRFGWPIFHGGVLIFVASYGGPKVRDWIYDVKEGEQKTMWEYFKSRYYNREPPDQSRAVLDMAKFFKQREQSKMTAESIREKLFEEAKAVTEWFQGSIEDEKTSEK